ncbi:histidine kinase [Proteiniborus sp. MB09-C3]|uniref:sensor histidine kinase n=1 Tax=Proteiniborus sp. MB09-C3 TaxID=3050072 RepID=UPI002557B928|nr:histidine kinase [Proteiniborus sp. MB09-C3]WIV12962.1 histidine kinase [Proteiniborus sp. MB09-C3]
MRRFIEKSFIALFCLYNNYMAGSVRDLALYFLISLIISLALDLFRSKKIRIFIYLSFFILYFYDSIFIYYLPLVLYNLYLDFDIYALLSMMLILMDFSIANILASSISIYLSIMTKKFSTFFKQNTIIRDELKENTIYLKKYNEQLKIDKEKNIHIAILTERNRIARELHDSIGHAISSSILQVEALKIISDSAMLEGLNLLQNTLSNGMNDIRNSIHNLYNESLDLESKIESICREVSNIDIDLIYKLENNLPYDLKFDILSIIKEAITNCVKHSNATKLKISLLNQPKFYSIIINDNGSNFDETDKLLAKGIGLLSMKEIAGKYNGFLNYEFNNGFKIHLILMKG